MIIVFFSVCFLLFIFGMELNKKNKKNENAKKEFKRLELYYSIFDPNRKERLVKEADERSKKEMGQIDCELNEKED